MATIPLSIDLELDDQFFEDILVTALEGGSNYWLHRVEFSYADAKNTPPAKSPAAIKVAKVIEMGGSVDFCYDGGSKWMNKTDLIEGLKLWVQKHTCNVSLICTSDRNHYTIDASDIDAGDADAILQYALFKELVYG